MIIEYSLGSTGDAAGLIGNKSECVLVVSPVTHPHHMTCYSHITCGYLGPERAEACLFRKPQQIRESVYVSV